MYNLGRAVSRRRVLTLLHAIRVDPDGARQRRRRASGRRAPGHCPQTSPIISGPFAKRDLQLKASYACSPACNTHHIHMRISKYPTTLMVRGSVGAVRLDASCPAIVGKRAL